jgi:hypothetical protein
MAYWIDDRGELREGTEEQGQRYGFRPATDEDLAAHNERLDTQAADTKGPLGLVLEGAKRGVGLAVDAPRNIAARLFGDKGDEKSGLVDETPHISGASLFPEAFSEEARLRTKEHPVYEGIGTGLAAAPVAAGVAAATGGLGLGALGPGIAAATASTVTEAAAQEYDDAWLEQRPMELKNVAGYTAMFAIGDVLLGGGAKLAKAGWEKLGQAAEKRAALGGRNLVAEATAKAERAAGGSGRAAQSVGAASAKDLAEPFDDAIAQMSDRDAVVLARDGEDHLHLAARHSADEWTRISKGLSESLGNQLKYEDVAIHTDALKPKQIRAQSEWVRDTVDQALALQEQLKANPKGGVRYGNAGKQIAEDLESYSRQLMDEPNPAKRFVLADSFKQTLQKRVMQIGGDFNGDRVAKSKLLELLRPLAGGTEKGEIVKGALLEGLENPKYWGRAGDLQKALNEPWHDMLQHWGKIQEKLLEHTGETQFGVMGAGRKVMQGTADRMMAVFQKDPRALEEIGKQLHGVFDGYRRLIEAREAHGLVNKEGLPELQQSLRNLMEDWNLAATVGVARNKVKHAQLDPRRWSKVLDLLEKTPMGVGGAIGTARKAAETLTGDLNIQKGTALHEVWDRALKRYAKHPSLGDPSISANYSPWMQDSLRARGAPIQGGPPPAAGGLFGKGVPQPQAPAPAAQAAGGGFGEAAAAAAKEHGAKVAGGGLFALGAGAQSLQGGKDDPNRPAQAGAGIMGLGLALMFKGKSRAVFWHEAEARGRGLPRGVKSALDELFASEEGAVRKAAIAARELPNVQAVHEQVDSIVQQLASRAQDNPEVMAQAGHFMSDNPQEEVEEYLRNVTMGEFADHAPRGLDAAPPHVRAIVDKGEELRRDLPDVFEKFDRDGRQRVYERQSAAGTAFHDEARSSGHEEIYVPLAKKAVEEGFQKHNLARRLAEEDWDELHDIEQDISDWTDDGVVVAEMGLEKHGIKEVPPWMRHYIHTGIERKVADAIQEYEKTAKFGARALGTGPFVLRGITDGLKPNAKGAELLEIVKAALGSDVNEHGRGVLMTAAERVAHKAMADALPTRAVPPAVLEAAAKDLVQALAGGASLSDARAAIVRTLSHGAEAVPLTKEAQRAGAEAFYTWSQYASKELGFSVEKAIADYAGDFDYKNINAYARGHLLGPDRALTEDGIATGARASKLATKLQTALDYAVDQGYTAPGLTYRGVLMNAADLARLDAADVVEAHAFMSSTTDPHYAWEFISNKQQLKNDPSLKRVLFEVVQKNGVPCNPAESEVLLRAGTRFRREPASGKNVARWRLVELDTPPKVPRTLSNPSALPWVAGGVFTLGSLTAADKAHAAEPEPGVELPELPDVGPSPEQGPVGAYRDAMRAVNQGGEAIIRQRASAALRGRIPGGRSALRAFTGRRDLDSAVDAARDAITSLQGNPEGLVDMLAGTTGELGSTHPAVYMALVQKAHALVGYLTPKVPQRTGKTLLDPSGMPPSYDRSVDFAHEVVGALMPTQAMSDIARLDAPAEETASFQQNWPELWEPLRAELLGQVQRRYEAGRPVDGEKLRALDALLQMDGQLDPSASTAVAQQLLTAQEQAPAGGAQQPPSGKGLSGKASSSFKTRLAGAQAENAIG